MKKLLNWEFSQVFRSKTFIGILAVCILFMLPVVISDEPESGFQVFLESCSNSNSVLLLVGSIFAGLHVSAAFENRKIQAAVMAGNSRACVLATKFLSYSAAIAIFHSVPLSAASLVGIIRYGVGQMDGSFFVAGILRGILYLLTEISFFSICFMLSVFIHNLGVSIAVNLAAALLINGAGQFLAGKSWAASFFSLTSTGQSFYLLVDCRAQNLVKAGCAAVAGIAVAAGVSYLKFRREELK